MLIHELSLINEDLNLEGAFFLILRCVNETFLKKLDIVTLLTKKWLERDPDEEDRQRVVAHFQNTLKNSSLNQAEREAIEELITEILTIEPESDIEV